MFGSVVNKVGNFFGVIKVSQAMRDSRLISAGIGGVFFVLNFFDVPVDKFFSGYGPAATAAAFSLVNFTYKLFGNYNANQPNEFSENIKDSSRFVSTGTILEKLKTEYIANKNMTENFLQRSGLTEGEIETLLNCDRLDNEPAQAILLKIYHANTFNIEKYPVSVTLAVMQMACHFMECMLVQVFADKDAFSSWAAKIVLANIMLVAFYNGWKTFAEVKRDYEDPTPLVICEGIFKSIEQHAAQIEAPTCDLTQRRCFA